MPPLDKQFANVQAPHKIRSLALFLKTPQHRAMATNPTKLAQKCQDRLIKSENYTQSTPIAQAIIPTKAIKARLNSSFHKMTRRMQKKMLDYAFSMRLRVDS